MNIAFISCVSTKLDRPAEAKDLYISNLFKLSYEYTNQNYDKVYILSAKYGLINPDTLIEPYDLTLNNFNQSQLKNWSKKIILQMKDKIKIDDQLYFYCGLNYRKYLIEWLPHTSYAPLKNLGIGRQLQWYKKRL